MLSLFRLAVISKLSKRQLCDGSQFSPHDVCKLNHFSVICLSLNIVNTLICMFDPRSRKQKFKITQLLTKGILHKLHCASVGVTNELM